MSCHQVGKNSYDNAIGKAFSRHDLIRREVAQGRQAYRVALVEESEKLDVRAAVEEHQRLQESIFPGWGYFTVASAQKDEAIGRFRDNQTQILVSTTVVK